MDEFSLTDEQGHLLELLGDDNSYYLNMGTVNTYDQFYPLYKMGFVTPASNHSTWYLTIKGYEAIKNIRAKRVQDMSVGRRLLLVAFEEGMRYAKRSSQEKITKHEFLEKALAAQNTTASDGGEE